MSVTITGIAYLSITGIGNMLTSTPANDTPPRVGRPPLNPLDLTHRLAIRITRETRDRIEAVAGKHRISEFIRDAIDAELARHENHLPSRKD